MMQMDLFGNDGPRFSFQEIYDKARAENLSMITYLCATEGLKPGDEFWVYGENHQDLYILRENGTHGCSSTRLRKENIKTGQEVFDKPGMISEVSRSYDY
jgi:hypothetical protein